MALAVEFDMEKLQALRGMADLLPEQTNLWQHIELCIRRHFTRAGISEIRTPLLEPTELFARSIGENTDVVGKEMYTFKDKGERSCTLRPEGTASIVRSAIQNGLLSQGAQKLWYCGPMFRYERPQAGRLRQFHQTGLEFLGFSHPRSDVEAISIAWDLLNDLGVQNLTLQINSLGDSEDRFRFRESLTKWLNEHLEKLDKDSQDRIEKNPLRILDTKDSATKALLKNAPLLNESLSTKSKQRFNEVKYLLEELHIPFQFNPLLVRGLDYYSHTAFEITSDQLGSQSTVCGGGRYDSLVKELGGPDTNAIGWAIGMERIVILLDKLKSIDTHKEQKIYLVNKGKEAEYFALKVTRALRLLDKIVEIDLSQAAFSKQLKRADKSGAKWAIIIGDNEAKEEKVVLKNLRSATEDSTSEKNLALNELLKLFT